MMRNLPVPVGEEDIDQMFDFADKDKDGRISYRWGTEDVQDTLEIFIFQWVPDHDKSSQTPAGGKY